MPFSQHQMDKNHKSCPGSLRKYFQPHFEIPGLSLSPKKTFLIFVQVTEDLRGSVSSLASAKIICSWAAFSYQLQNLLDYFCNGQFGNFSHLKMPQMLQTHLITIENSFSLCFELLMCHFCPLLVTSISPDDDKHQYEFRLYILLLLALKLGEAAGS